MHCFKGKAVWSLLNVGCVYHVSSECFQYCSGKQSETHHIHSVSHRSLAASIREILYYIRRKLNGKMCCECFWRRREEVWLLDPPLVLCGPWHRGQGLYLSDPVCVSVFVCVYEWFGGGGGSVWDKELLGFLHLFSHSIGVRPPLPGLQSPGLLLWCQHEFASNLQRKNNNNKECVYPAMVFCMLPLICWNCVKLTSFKNVWVSKIRRLQAGRLVNC